MDNDKKITNGANDRPRNETIAQSGAGIPDDSSRPLEADDAEVDRVRDNLSGRSPRQQLKEEVREEIEKPQRGSA
ncbi:uncharacterized protein with von Willebrand factor type A (vWA) domain [Pseudorhizobium tarimense]|uniref:Uncharacterized protein with von Willebrand factor type A (VWA) domain n=1 Tax=Pseudorhizobium tarimense TaxID=1079109 RepID=A0ABV2H1Y7_9HYPH|nr:hypothetical protein [Pseudorhizobium tarimense]MCJ8517972.1 hypothetical protein [Pseudorhizobium tarimense]